MATTKIWSIKNHLDVSIKYIINLEKTINKDYDKSYYNELEMTGYTEYDFKREKIEYVSALNCSESNPYKDMQFTKEQYYKIDGILGFHAYQSFKEGEVTSDVAHEIGVKLAEEMWGDYEVVVATHQNTNHIHNHFIINSVSYLTGKKYNSNRANLSKLRQISDSLCKEYNLSTVKERNGYDITYKYKVLSDDYYKMVKEDVDMAISESLVMKQFKDRLKQLGYHFYSRYGVITIWKEGYDKVRLEQAFGSDYSIDKLNEQFYNTRYRKYSPMSNNDIYKSYLLKTNKQHKGIYGLYLYYRYLLKVFPQEHPKQYLPYSIRQEIKKLDSFSEQTRFIVANNIETKEDLEEFAKNNYEKYSNLMGKRENLWKRYHRAKSENDKSKIIAVINSIQPTIKELLKLDNYCKEIRKRSESIQDNLNNFDKDL